MLSVREKKSICKSCPVFRTEYFCAAQKEHDVTPWLSHMCPRGIWTEAVAAQEENKTPPEDSQALLQLLTRPAEDTGVPAITEVLRRFSQEVADAEAKKGGCTGCAKGAILRRYMSELQPLLPLLKHA